MLAIIIAHPWLTLFVALGVANAVETVSIHVLRTVRILLRGWPPAHVDADGDFRDSEEAA